MTLSIWTKVDSNIRITVLTINNRDQIVKDHCFTYTNIMTLCIEHQ